MASGPDLVEAGPGSGEPAARAASAVSTATAEATARRGEPGNAIAGRKQTDKHPGVIINHKSTL